MNDLIDRSRNVRRTSYAMPDGEISAVHFGPIKQPIELIFLHANGFHGLAYQTLLNGLGVHCLALDLRGHGANSQPATRELDAAWRVYAADVLCFLDQHIGRKVSLAGHSMGASSAILAAEISTKHIKNVAAFDPIVFRPSMRIIMKTKFGRALIRHTVPIAKGALKRRSQFADLDEVYDRYQGRGLFKKFSEEALKDYIAGGFKKNQQGVELCCHPSWEYYGFTVQSDNVIKAMTSLPDGSQIIITDYMKPKKAWMQTLRKNRPGTHLDHRPDLGHFFPLVNLDVSKASLAILLSQ